MNRVLPRLGALFTAMTAMSVAHAQATVDPAGQQERLKVEGTVEKKYTIRLETTQFRRYCKAKVSLEYSQYDTEAGVKGIIENPDCGASGGDYTMSIRVRDENGEYENILHEEAWARNDDENVVFERRYVIGENADLIRIRARNITCVCAAEAPEGGKE